MQDRLTDIELRLSVLEDIRAIKDLKYRYLRACDRKQPQDVLDCFDPDAALIAYDGFPSFNSREAFVQVFEQMACKATIIDMHHGENPTIELTGPDSASGRWDLFFQSIDTQAGTVTQMGCEYVDIYRRKAGRWWISETATRRTSFLMQRRQDDGTMSVIALGEPPSDDYSTDA